MNIRAGLLLLQGCGGILLSACASIHADHFYALQPLPAAQAASADQLQAEVSIRLTVPSMVDRNQMVLRKSAGVLVLEHERWASPLVDQINTVLGQDIEQRRPDVLVTTRPVSQTSGTTSRSSIQLDVVDLSLRRAGPVVLEARWHVQSLGGNDQTGRVSLSAQPKTPIPADIAVAVSQCLSELADRLVPLIAGPSPQP